MLITRETVGSLICMIEKGRVSALGDENPMRYLKKNVPYTGNLLSLEKVSWVSPFYYICRNH